MSSQAQGNDDPRLRHDVADGEQSPLPVDGQAPSRAAARLLETTAREADRWRSEATQEAAALVASATKESAEILDAARSEAARLLAEARRDAEQARREAQADAERMREDAAAATRVQEHEIARLRQAADEHRELLHDHLTEMLRRVDAGPSVSRSDQHGSSS